MVFRYLPPVREGKLVPRNFGHIGHLRGSRMIDNEDTLINEAERVKFVLCKRDPKDDVIITEKIDGMNAGVVKLNGLLYPINKKGYDVRGMGMQRTELRALADSWTNWVDEHYEIYDDILEEGERLVFENAIMMHTLRYRFSGDPVFLLAKYDANNRKLIYDELCQIGKEYKLRQPPMLCRGVAIDPSLVINQYPKGLVGARDGIEGIVYSYEHAGQVEGCAKYVSNELIGSCRGTCPMYYNEIR